MVILRIWAVLQRIALCYGIVSVLALFVNHRYVLPLAMTLLVVYGALLWWGNGYAQESSNILARVVIAGYLLSFLLPLNKRIWSPSYVLMTCGLAALLQGLLMYVIDVKGSKGWCTFFHVFGVNPLFLYVSSEILSIVLKHVGVSESVYNGLQSPAPPQQARISSPFHRRSLPS